jgi:hypothetical protein
MTTTLMKTIPVLLVLAAASAGFGQTATITPPTVAPPPVNVRVVSEVEELARGYATAFAAMTRSPIHLIHSRDDNTTVLSGIKSVKATGGVLVVENDRGLIYVINPRDVVMITDATPKKEQP